MTSRDTPFMERSGWRLLKVRGSHAQYLQAEDSSLITIPWHHYKLGSITTSALSMRMANSHILLVEGDAGSLSAFAPSLPGIAAHAESISDLVRNFAEAHAFHISTQLERKLGASLQNGRPDYRTYRISHPSK